MSETRVVNIRDLPTNPADWPADHEYIGRAVPRRRLASSPWRNPYAIKAAREAMGFTEPEARRWVIDAFERYLASRPDLLVMLPVLRGKTLVCWCKEPDREVPCHGDVLARLADGVPVVGS